MLHLAVFGFTFAAAGFPLFAQAGKPSPAVPHEPDFAVWSGQVRSQTKAAMQMLQTTKPALSLPKVSFALAVEFARDVWGADLVADYPGLEEAGWDIWADVELEFRHATLRQVLEKLLAAAGGKRVQGKRMPMYVDADGGIVISSPERVGERAGKVAVASEEKWGKTAAGVRRSLTGVQQKFRAVDFFQPCLKSIGERWNVKVSVDVDALAEDGADTERVVTVTDSGPASLHKALERFLDELSRGMPEGKSPAWAISADGKTVEISTRAKIGKRAAGAAPVSYIDIDSTLAVVFVADADEAVRRNPTDAGAHLARALGRETAGDVPGALRDCDRAIELFPQLDNAFPVRARLRERAGDWRGALADWTAEIRRTRGNPSACAEAGAQYALVNSRRGEGPASAEMLNGLIADMTKSIEARPLDPSLYRARAVLFQAKSSIHHKPISQKWRDPATDFLELAAGDRAVAEKLDPPEAFAKRAAEEGATIRELEGDPDNRLLTLHLMARCRLRARMRDWNGAVADAERVLKAEPRVPECLGWKGAAKAARGDHAGAMADFNAACKGLAGEKTRLVEYEIRINRGLALLRLGEAAAAQKDFDEAVWLCPNCEPLMKALIKEANAAPKAK